MTPTATASSTGSHHHSDQPFSPTETDTMPVEVTCQKLKKLAISVSRDAPSTPQPAMLILETSNAGFGAPPAGAG